MWMIKKNMEALPNENKPFCFYFLNGLQICCLINISIFLEPSERNFIDCTTISRCQTSDGKANKSIWTK